MTSVGYAIGVDIGGTTIATIAMDSNYNVIEKVELKSIVTNKETMFSQVTKSIDYILQKTNTSSDNIKGMGIGVPGKVDKQNGIAVYQNNLPWRNFPIVDRLHEHYQIKRINIDNDVYLAALSEWKQAQIDKRNTFVYITVSTGISCSIIENGQFIRGDGFAGEIGLFPVFTSREDVEISRLEKIASGPAIETYAQQQLKDKNLKTSNVFEKYTQGCQETITIVNDMVNSISHGVYSIICLLDPHKIVFGGGVINHNPFLVKLIKEKLENLIIPQQKKSLKALTVSHFKDDAGVIGAGMLGLNHKIY